MVIIFTYCNRYHSIILCCCLFLPPVKRVGQGNGRLDITTSTHNLAPPPPFLPPPILVHSQLSSSHPNFPILYPTQPWQFPILQTSAPFLSLPPSFIFSSFSSARQGYSRPNSEFVVEERKPNRPLSLSLSPPMPCSWAGVRYHIYRRARQSRIPHHAWRREKKKKKKREKKWGAKLFGDGPPGTTLDES